jgi:hypothetical protein
MAAAEADVTECAGTGCGVLLLRFDSARDSSS